MNEKSQPNRNAPIIAIRAANSIEFVEYAFKANSGNIAFATIRSEADYARLTGVEISKVATPREKTGWASIGLTPSRSNDVAQIAFTSGTTGAPKAIVLTHANIADTTARIIEAMSINAEIREYIGVPVTYSFGLGRARVVSAAGGAFYIPPHGFSPGELAQMLRQGEVNASSIVPTMARLLLDNPDIIDRAAGANLRWLELGSQMMTANEKTAIRAMFPNAIIVQHYGLTEASRTTFLKISNCEGADLSSVGAPMGATEIAIGDDGRIRIRGPHVAVSELVNGAYRSLVDGENWLTTNDLGVIRDGNLHLEGRTDDLINCGGVKLNPDVLELAAIAAAGGQAGDIAIARIPDRQRGEGILVAIRDDARLDESVVRNAVTSAAQAFGVNAAGAISLFRLAEIPRTETGKLQRSKLAEIHAASGASAQTASRPVAAKAASADAGINETILKVWREALGVDDVSPDLSFYDIGGDSLSAVTVALNLERAGLDPQIAQGVFSGRTIRELSAELAPSLAAEPTAPAPRTSKTGVAQLNEAANFVKGLALICMIGSHWAPPYLSKLGQAEDPLSAALAPFFSLGTPTLAFIFGVGLAVFQARQFERSRQSFDRNNRIAMALLAGGAFINGALELVSAELRGGIASLNDAIAAFYGPFLYFLIATASLPLWLRFAKTSPARIASFSVAGAAFYCAYLVVAASNGDWTKSTLAGEVLTGRWSILLMGAISLFGVATGLLFRKQIEEEGSVGKFAALGAILMGGAIAYSFLAGKADEWIIFPKTTDLMTLSFYSGLSIVILALLPGLSDGKQLAPAQKYILETVCSLGILLFPLFVLQSLVYRMAAIINQFTHFGFLAALSVLIVIYGIAAHYMVQRVKRLYYGSTAPGTR